MDKKSLQRDLSRTKLMSFLKDWGYAQMELNSVCSPFSRKNKKLLFAFSALEIRSVISWVIFLKLKQNINKLPKQYHFILLISLMLINKELTFDL